MGHKHILLKTQLLVDPIMQSLGAGADFSQLAREHSACPSGQNGGDWGNLSDNDLPEEIISAISAAAIGEVIGPIKSRHGLHLIKKEM